MAERTEKHSGISDEELMLRSSEGDRMAFEYLYERYFQKLVWFAGGFTRDREKAEDVVQEVFIKIIEKPGLFDRNKKFSTWVYTVTANQCKNLVRNEENRLRLLKENVRAAGSEDAKNTFDKKLLSLRVTTIMNQMSDKERNIYELRFEQDLSIKEIAGLMDIPEGSVKSGIFHLLKKIAKHLKDFIHATK